MKQQSKKVPALLLRSIASVVALALIVGLWQWHSISLQAAGDYPSLTGIEALKKSVSASDPYTIVEIVPTADSGTIGFYLPKQEPTVAAFQQVTTVSKEDRETAMDAYFTALETAGILSAGNSTPLTKTAEDYREYLPWETAPTEAVVLSLIDTAGNARVETTTVPATFGVATGETALFDRVYHYEVATTDATHYQVVQTFVGGDQGEGFFYYNPVFTALDLAEIALLTPEELAAYDGIAVYLQKDGIYQYHQRFGEEGFELISTETYYIVTAEQMASATFDETTAPYAATEFTFETVAPAGELLQFIEETQYRYVGEGGHFAMTPSATETAVVGYSSVAVTFGYQNNNWFRAAVLDDASDVFVSQFPIEVVTLTPDDPALANHLATDADLIVLGNGFSLTGEEPATYQENDLPTELVDQIKTLVGADDETIGLPIVADLSILNLPSADSNAAALVTDLLAGASLPSGGVVENKYFFQPTAEVTAFVTDTFNTSLPTLLYEGTDAPYHAVLAQIQEENDLRQAAEFLPETVSMATAVRYAMNYADRRLPFEKNMVRVLELQPNHGSTLTAGEVVSWLPEDSTITVNDIAITTMPINTFVGKVEELNETYDLIYIGDSTDGMLVTRDEDGNPIADYNDKNMEGLLYSNIGDSYYARESLAGLLDSDYDGTVPTQNITVYGMSAAAESFAVAPLESNLEEYRFSGNDITAEKQEALTQFAKAGLPIVLGDELVHQPQESQPEMYISLKAAAVASSDGQEITMWVSNPSEDEYAALDISYQWKNNWRPIEGATDPYYTATATGSYHCTVSIAGKSGDTNAITVTAETLDHISLESWEWNSTSLWPTGFSPQPNYYAVLLDTAVADGNHLLTANEQFIVGAGASLSYRWYTRADNSVGTAWTVLDTDQLELLFPGAALADGGQTLRVPQGVGVGSWLSCEVLLDGVPYYSQTVQLGASGIGTGQDVTAETTTTNVTSKYEMTFLNDHPQFDDADSTNGNDEYYRRYLMTGEDTTTLGTQLRMEPTDATIASACPPIEYEYQWYLRPQSGGRFALLPAGENTTEEWLEIPITATASRDYAYIATIIGTDQTVKSKGGYFAIKQAEGGTTGFSYRIGFSSTTSRLQLPEIEAMGLRVNESRIDNSSYLYDTLDTLLADPTITSVLSVTGVQENREAFAVHLNRSSPTIQLTTQPTPYENLDQLDSTHTLLSNHTLNFTFTIQNKTAVQPLETRYELHLYLDQNSDGIYDEGEKVSGGTILQSGIVVESSDLQQDISYTFSRALPTALSGVISWKLKVVQVGEVGIEASEQGITYSQVGTIAEEIRVLQIIPQGERDLNALFSEEFAQIDAFYDITVTTATIQELNAMTQTEVEAEFSAYHMLLLGFDEIYGYQDSTANGLNLAVAEEVVDFIELGKSVLFTHDTTSFSNLPSANYPAAGAVGPYFPESIGSTSYYGYYFNLVLRNAIGLDRYGVTSSEYGISSYSPLFDDLNTTGKAIVSNGYEAVDDATLQAIIDSGYAIAYAPKSNREELLPQTQGYQTEILGTHGILQDSKSLAEKDNDFNSGLDRYRLMDQLPSLGSVPRNYLDTRTETIEQINEGQITTFPYNLNEVENPTIAPTHFQYYQLNMHSGDAVVWYALDGENYDNPSGDVVNNYYIYNYGNVTYSGAGHVDGSGYFEPTEFERQLFINTIVAAYRVVNIIEPTVTFEDETGKIITQSYVQTMYESDSLRGEVLQQDLDKGLQLPFIVREPSLEINKYITVQLYYELLDPTLIQSIQQAVANGTDLPTGGPYYYRNDSGQILEVNAATTTELLGSAQLFSVLTHNELHIEHLIGNERLPIGEDVGLLSDSPYVLHLSPEALKTLGDAATANEMDCYLQTEITIGLGDEAVSYVALSERLTVNKLGLFELG